MKSKQVNQGYTLIELILVVAIIGILSSIMAPRLGYAVKKATEGGSKGNLAVLRSSVGIAFSSNDGMYPTDNLSSIVPYFISSIPTLRLPGSHPDSTVVTTETTLTDSGTWSYDNVWGDPNFGVIKIGCTHDDVLGKVWSSY